MVIYLCACAAIACYQRKLIYHPPHVDLSRINELARQANVVRWTNSTGAAIGWKRSSPIQPAKGQALIVYGNASWSVGCAHYADDIQSVAPFDTYILEYPGYADRAGAPSEKSIFAAADEGLQLMASNGPVYLIGESFGTGVAAYLAGTHPDKIAGVVLFAPYNRLADAGQYHFRIFPASLILVDRFDSEDYLRNYRGPLAIFVGDQDRVVPPWLGRQLYDQYAGPKKLWDFPMDDHGSLFWRTRKVWVEINNFWQTNSPVTSHR